MSEYIIEIPDYVPPFDPAARAASLGEEIVRCRDCRHHIDTPKRGCRCYHWITLDCYENPVPSEVEPNGFCSWGERRNA